MDANIVNLGPLAFLAGTWEGDKGKDIALDDNRGTEQNLYRERMTFIPIGRVENHEQNMYCLRYTTMAWRIGVADSFHEEVGYWLWDAANRQAMRCFMIPRGVTLIAGGTVQPDAKTFELSAAVGSETYGILSNKFLDLEFKTVAFKLKVTNLGSESFSYEEDTQLKIKGQEKIFHHTDGNTMKRVSS